jgi:hypothetical protein
MDKRSTGTITQIFEVRNRLFNGVSWPELLVLATFLSLPCTGLADSAIYVNAGYLRANSSTALTSGGLLLFVAAGDGNATTFDNTLTSGEYVAGGDVNLGAFAFNTNGGTSGTGGATRNMVTISTSLYMNVNAGAYVELCWFPAITLTQYNAGVTPTNGMMFGAYNPKEDNSSQSLAPDGGDPWELPGDGGTVTLTFLTTDDSGTQPVAEGYASLMVVPEPSAWALIGWGIGGLGILRLRSKSSQV